MGAGFALLVSSAHGAAYRPVGIVVEHQIGMTTGAIQPIRDARLLLLDRSTHGVLGCLPIGVGGSCSDATLAPQSFAQLRVRSSYMLAQGVPAFAFIARQIPRNQGECR